MVNFKHSAYHIPKKPLMSNVLNVKIFSMYEWYNSNFRQKLYKFYCFFIIVFSFPLFSSYPVFDFSHHSQPLFPSLSPYFPLTFIQPLLPSSFTLTPTLTFILPLLSSSFTHTFSLAKPATSPHHISTMPCCRISLLIGK